MSNKVTDLSDIIVEKLKAKQKDLGLTDEAFAQKIGVSRPLWALMKTGKREPGLKFIKAVVRVFPEFTVDVLSYLRDEVSA